MNPPVEPLDGHNRALLEQVVPPDRPAPASSTRYDLVVIGAGTAGLVTAAGAAGLGARVALVERHLMGGDCLNVGCVPSKALLRSAHALAESRRLAPLGLRIPSDATADFPAVMERLRSIRAGIAPDDGAPRFTRLGVDVYRGQASFVSGDRVEIDGSLQLRFHRAVIATGARPAIPEDIPGLAEARPLTNETIFNLTALPARLAVLGGGPIGCELAQAFARLGSVVTIIHRGEHLLDREDPDAAAVVGASLVRDGIRVLTRARLDRVTSEGASHTLHAALPGAPAIPIEADAILIAAGRIPNVEGMGLERVGVEFDPRTGVRVDDFLRTTHPRIYACGDVCLPAKFTHAADAAARVVIQNALFALGPLGRRRFSRVNMAWCTYTDPELAHTGRTLHELHSAGIETESFTRHFADVHRAITESETEGFVRVHVRKGSDRILGATVVGRGAGDLISELSVAIEAGIGLGRLAGVIHPYPTRAEAIRQLGDQYKRSRLTPRAARILRALVRLHRMG